MSAVPDSPLITNSVSAAISVSPRLNDSGAKERSKLLAVSPGLVIEEIILPERS